MLLKTRKYLKELLPLTKENVEKIEKLVDSIHTKEEMFKAMTEPINIRK